MEGQDDAYGQEPLPEELPNPRSSPPLPVHSMGPKIVHCPWCTSAGCAERDCGQRVGVPAGRVRTAIDRRVTGEIDRVEKSSTVVSDRGLDPLTLLSQCHWKIVIIRSKEDFRKKRRRTQPG